MKNEIKKYKYLIIVIVILLCLTILSITLKRKETTSLENNIKDMGLTIIKILYEPIKNIKTKNKEYENLKSIEIEYNLNKTIIEEQKKTIEELKKLTEINYTLEDYKEINASVIKRNLDTFYMNITLDKGELNGVEKDSAVVNKDGMIGIVTNTTSNTSTVKLLTNLKLSVKIISNEKEIYGILNKYEDNLYVIEGISENTIVENGMEVLTTGLGNNIPSGIKIGTVVKEEKDHFDLNRTIYVKPIVNFNDINYVKILSKNI